MQNCINKAELGGTPVTGLGTMGLEGKGGRRFTGIFKQEVLLAQQGRTGTSWTTKT